jgi:hypothetical protein
MEVVVLAVFVITIIECKMNKKITLSVVTLIVLVIILFFYLGIISKNKKQSEDLVLGCKATFDIYVNCTSANYNQGKTDCKNTKFFAIYNNINGLDDVDMLSFLEHNYWSGLKNIDQLKSEFYNFTKAKNENNTLFCYKISSNFNKNSCLTIVGNRSQICDIFFTNITDASDYPIDKIIILNKIRYQICINYIKSGYINSENCDTLSK